MPEQNVYVVPETDKIWVRLPSGGGKGGFGGIPPQNNPWHRLAEIRGTGYLTKCRASMNKKVVQRTTEPKESDGFPFCNSCWRARGVHV